LRVLGGRGRPLLSARDLSSRLGAGRGNAQSLRELLVRLAEGGALERVGGAYRLRRKDGLVEGEYHAPGEGNDASGTVIDDHGELWQVPETGEAGDGDRVLIQPVGRKRSGRGEVVELMGGGRASWVGVLERGRGGYEITPYRDDALWCVRVAARDLGGAQPGEVVQAIPVRHHSKRRGRVSKDAEPWGRIVECFGRPGDAEADFQTVVWRRRLPREFGEEVLAEAKAARADIATAEWRDRLDLRDRCFLTIDPATARDHDDAIAIEPAAKGAHTLWVAIADVSHYVAPGSAIDREAWRRGNSVYFPDRAIPMLPERLSGDLCSLRPEVDRRVLAVEMEVSREGRIQHARFHRAVIQSRARLAYEQAAAVMEPDEHPDSAKVRAGMAQDVVAQLERLATVARGLMKQRFAAGALELDLPEPVIVLDEQGRPVDVKRSERNLAHRAIEEAMLAANRAVARALGGAGRAAVFRVHEPPSPAKRAELRALYESFGLIESQQSDELSTSQMAQALRRVAGRPEEALVNLATLRAMQRARYCAEDLGHFALAFDAYLHFTSPIRRYADLVVHRALHRMLLERQANGADGAGSDVRTEAASEHEAMERAAARTSARERIAVAAERDMLDLKKCAFMRSQLGRTLGGVVTGVARHGLYVTLDDYFVEGLVPIARLPGFFDLNEQLHALVARGSGARFALGDRLQIRVTLVDQLRGWINFSLETTELDEDSGRSKGAARGRRPKPSPRRSGAPTRRRGRR
jgi:ribonuclease R